MKHNKTVIVHYIKQSGEFIITTRNTITGKLSKTHANKLTDEEKAFTNEAKHKFEDSMSVYWIN